MSLFEYICDGCGNWYTPGDGHACDGKRTNKPAQPVVSEHEARKKFDPGKLAQPTEPDWRDTACENIERALARAPREWWINPPDLDARNLNGGDYTTAHVAFIPRSDYVHVIEHSAFQHAVDMVVRKDCELARLRSECAELRAILSRYTDERRKLDVIDKLQAELAAEKGQTERLRAEHHFVVQAGQRLREERDRLRALLERVRMMHLGEEIGRICDEALEGGK